MPIGVRRPEGEPPDRRTEVVTADYKLLEVLNGTPLAHLAHSLAYVGSLVPDAE
jgi:hypothetical protein